MMTRPTSPSANPANTANTANTETDADADAGAEAGTEPGERDPEADDRPRRRRGLRRLLDRLTADPTRLHAEELQERSAAAGARPIAQCPDREKVRIAGTLRTVTIRPRAGVPSLEANLWDGTGDVAVVWLGRRDIPGIGPGRHIRVEGRITTLGGHRAIYNPIYELLPSQGD